MNIGLIYGSKSTEHEISIITMLQVKEFIKDNVYLIYMDKDMNLFLANDTVINDYKDLKNLNKKKFRPISFVKQGIKGSFKKINIDSAIILNHGKNGEDGMIANLLEFYDIPYVGTNPISSGILLDKVYTHDILSKNNFLVTKSIIYTYEDYLNDKKIPIMPCIIKPSTLGSSIGINIVNEEDELEKALLDSLKYDNKLIIEELISDFVECNVSCYFDKEVVVSNIERIKKDEDFLSFKDKYEKDEKLGTHEINPDMDQKIIDKIKVIAKDVYTLFNCRGIIRIDLMIKDDLIYVNEVNTIPGALAHYLYDDFHYVINKVINQSIFDYNKKKKIISSHQTNILTIKSVKK